MAINLTHNQIWGIIVIGFLIIAFLGYNIWSGITDRAIIKEQVASILGNINATEITQNKTLDTLRINGMLLTETINLIENNTSTNKNMTITNREMISDLADLYGGDYQNRSIAVHNETLQTIQNVERLLQNLTKQLG